MDDGELHTDIDSSDSLDSDSDSEADRQNMGQAGGAITKADKRVIARYAASFGREWATMRGNERWDPFEAMVCIDRQCVCIVVIQVISSTHSENRNHGWRYIDAMKKVRVEFHR